MMRPRLEDLFCQIAAFDDDPDRTGFPPAKKAEHGSQNTKSQGVTRRGRGGQGAVSQDKEGQGRSRRQEAVKRKSRAKTAKEVRLKAFWGVFNQSMKRVALFEYSQRKQADKKAAELSTNPPKSPHFVQPVKEVIEE